MDGISSLQSFKHSLTSDGNGDKPALIMPEQELVGDGDLSLIGMFSIVMGIAIFVFFIWSSKEMTFLLPVHPKHKVLLYMKSAGIFTSGNM